ncbi:hypothetical protein HaLaN_26436 [Haematococcus lacustris]|uniref:Uncharacterized protein n=1 Tax=Haematococcus lacustris TaxID=44745 RepID=A0A6A0A697_HAELA|nr:hypothetical protein HaLaN_26436 [Haematococcus lacustris]
MDVTAVFNAKLAEPAGL